MNETTNRTDKLGFYTDREILTSRTIGGGWVVKSGGVVVAGPYGHRAIAAAEAQRRHQLRFGSREPN